MRPPLKLGLLTLLLVLRLAADEGSRRATVSFTLDFPGSNPSHYEIVIGTDGQGSYSSDGRLNENSEPADPSPLAFTASASLRSQVFNLTERAHYFSGKLDSSRRNMANTGQKTLAYQNGERTTKASYNYSSLQPVEQLTAIFEALSTTLEFGRRLSYYHKYQKLALDDDLKRMEELQRENSLGDVRSIAPILEEIAQDPSVLNVSRARALRLLATAGN